MVPKPQRTLMNRVSGYAEDVLDTNVGLVPGAAFLSKASKPKALVTKVREVLATEVSS